MTNDELKKKIAEIIESEFENRCRKTNCHNCDLYPDGMCQPNMYADALIAAGIGDVKEAELRAEVAESELERYTGLIKPLEDENARLKHRAEVAERALKHMASDYWGVECFCHGCYESGCRKSCGEKYLIFDEEDAVNCLVKNFLQQAEKELAEEGKDE